MKLTKEQAISEHRKMWRWLAENTGKSKEYYINEHGYKEIDNDCFCCEYVLQNRPGCRNCRYCPVEWSNEQCISCYDLYNSWRCAFQDGDYYKAAFFAWQIANLPEREDLEND